MFSSLNSSFNWRTSQQLQDITRSAIYCNLLLLPTTYNYSFKQLLHVTTYNLQLLIQATTGHSTFIVIRGTFCVEAHTSHCLCALKAHSIIQIVSYRSEEPRKKENQLTFKMMRRLLYYKYSYLHDNWHSILALLIIYILLLTIIVSVYYYYNLTMLAIIVSHNYNLTMLIKVIPSPAGHLTC